MAGSDFEGKNLFPTKSAAERLCARGRLTRARLLGTVYSKHSSSEAQPKYGRGLIFFFYGCIVLLSVTFNLLLGYS